MPWCNEALNPQMVEMLAASLDQAGHKRQAKMTRDTIDYHTSPVEAAGIADEANVKLLVLTHIVPPLPNALMRHMLRDVKGGARKRRYDAGARLAHDLPAAGLEGHQDRLSELTARPA